MKTSDIQSVDWTRLRGVDGENTGASGSLADLLEGDEAARANAHSDLLGELVPEAGEPAKWCAAGAAATPFLVEMAGIEGHPAQPRSLILLTDLLAGNHASRSLDGIDMKRAEERKRYARGHARSIYRAILAAGDSLLAEVDSQDSRVRSCAGFLLAFLSELAPRSRELLERAVASEREPWAQASLMLSLALVSRYEGGRLSVSSLPKVSGPTQLFPWLAELCAEEKPHAPTPEELGPERRRALLALLRAGNPPEELFPWHRARIPWLLRRVLQDRGEPARMLAASVLAEVAAEVGVGGGAYAVEALRLSFDEGTREPLLLSKLDEGHRAIVATLSTQDFPGVAFAAFGLPPKARDRLRWLGLAPKTALEREFDGVPLWQILKEKQGRGTAEERKQRRGAVWAEIDARLKGTDRLEALVLIANGASGLLHVVDVSDLCRVVEQLGAVATEWARAKLPELMVENKAALRASGAGMVLLWSIARSLPAGEMLPAGYDELFTDIVEMPVLRGVLERMPQARREAVLLPMLKSRVSNPWAGHKILRKLVEVADLDFGPEVRAALCDVATAVAKGNSFLAGDDPAAADALRKQVQERFG